MNKTTISDNNRSSYEQNKREMFDGMRAYHGSEHQHKRDAVNFLRSILGVAAGVYGVIIGSFFTPDLTIEYATPLAWGILFFVALVIFITVNATNRKIKADHNIYKRYGAEYTRFSYMLELHKTVVVDTKDIEGKLIDINKPIGQGDGYKKTMAIIKKQGWGVFTISLILTVLVTFVKSQ